MFDADRTRAKEAWDRQQHIEAQLHEADRTILEAHLNALDRQRRDTRRRVLLEMFGLLLVGIGTALS